MNEIKTALVHYWLTKNRGGERVLKAVQEEYPQSDIYTHVHDKALTDQLFPGSRIEDSMIGRLPLAKKYYQYYLLFMPYALEQFDFNDYDLVISSESGPAKNIVTSWRTLHICYCHSPMRYVWNMYYDYVRSKGFLTRKVFELGAHYLRAADRLSADRVDHFVANSSEVAHRIEKFYRREAEVIHPPVDTKQFYAVEHPEDFYFYCGELVAYKRVDLAVEACNRLGKRLVVIGDGEERARLQKMAGPTVTFLGRQPHDVLSWHYANCRALLFPGEEDFGIVPIEVMASGRPVIAFGRGGALDYVVDGKTGYMFAEQTVESMIRAIGEFETTGVAFDAARMIDFARHFDVEIFKDRFSTFVERKYEEHRRRLHQDGQPTRAARIAADMDAGGQDATSGVS
ncbi:glycosyltransferase [Arboricoccus pini]|nr:glycosyltransferase [Arboricoccus pini]